MCVYVCFNVYVAFLAFWSIVSYTKPQIVQNTALSPQDAIKKTAGHPNE